MKIFIIGPGGVGKTTVGKILSEKLCLKIIDLDEEFMKTIGHIGNYINIKGYEKYYKQNSKLFFSILEKNIDNYIFITSSGFLTYNKSLTQKHLKKIENSGISILLLPSKSIKLSTDIVIKRQLLRGFNLEKGKETKKFIERYDIYKNFGDIQIFSHNTPQKISEKIIKKLTLFKDQSSL